MSQHTAQSSNLTFETELPGVNSVFVSLQEFGSDLDWQEAMADAWGMPCPAPASSNGLLSQLAALPQKLIALSTTALRAVSSGSLA